MTFSDIVGMALRNLWSRKLRSFLNLLGVVMACVVLTMMLAGTRGVDESFDRMIRGSEEIRRFAMYPNWTSGVQVPLEVTAINGEMDDARRVRLQKRLRSSWLSAQSTRTALDPETLEALRELPHMAEVRPETQLRGTVELDGKTESASIRVAGEDQASKARLLAGNYLEQDDGDGLLLGEYAAYRLGYVSDAELSALVGKTVILSLRLQALPSSPLQRHLAAAHPDMIRKLTDAIGKASLDPEEKATLSSFFVSTQASENDELRLEVVIRGVVREAEEGEGLSLFDLVRTDSQADLFMTADRVEGIEAQKDGFQSFYAAVGVVDDVQHLRELSEEVEKQGFRTRSSLSLVERIDEELRKVRVAVGALSLIILLISAVGISNTMLVSVLERVREFGILKALGARDQSVLFLMLVEGALTGFLGAMIGILSSLAASRLVTTYAQAYIGKRIREDFDSSVFAFSLTDMLMVTVIAVGICVAAAILPAWRAARLDPVVAMRG